MDNTNIPHFGWVYFWKILLLFNMYRIYWSGPKIYACPFACDSWISHRTSEILLLVLCGTN